MSVRNVIEASSVLSIMFVEDEADIRDVVSIATAHDRTIKLECFCSGREAIEYAKRTGGKIDVALLNVLLPDIHGVDLLQELSACDATADATKIIITASIPAGGVQRYLAAGADAVITKPFDIAALVPTIRTAHAKTVHTRCGTGSHRHADSAVLAQGYSDGRAIAEIVGKTPQLHRDCS